MNAPQRPFLNTRILVLKILSDTDSIPRHAWTITIRGFNWASASTDACSHRYSSVLIFQCYSLLLPHIHLRLRPQFYRSNFSDTNRLRTYVFPNLLLFSSPSSLRPPLNAVVSVILEWLSTRHELTSYSLIYSPFLLVRSSSFTASKNIIATHENLVIKGTTERHLLQPIWNSLLSLLSSICR